MSQQPAPQVVIYGSCVARDTFEFLKPRGYGLVDYVARQSLISAFSHVEPDTVGEVTAESAFQRRMLENDWRGRLASVLEAKADRIDVLLWDLCDERLGVRELGEGGFITRSVDLLSTGADARIDPQSRVIDFGTPAHLRLWREALTQWRGVLTTLGLLDKVVLLAPPWAQTAVDGTPSPTSFGRTPQEANALFAEYHRTAVEMLGCPVVTLGEEVARSDQTHQWGFAPFHYARENYVSMADDIEAAFTVQSQDPRSASPESP